MLRTTTLILFIVLVKAGWAQIWCPPGATWHYQELSLGYMGYTHRAYVGDTIHLGVQSQRFHVTGMRIEWPGWPEPDTTWIDQYQHTYVSDSTVFVRAMVNGTVQWDTLLRFDAVPGDRWFLPNHDLYCDESSIEGMLEVIDTGHVDLDGASLRYWNYGSVNEIGQVQWNGQQYFERIGFLGGFVPFPFECAIIEVGEILNCYQDSEVSFIRPGSPIGTTCDITMGLGEHTSNGGLPIPNPGTDHFALTLRSSPHTITLLDATGRIVLLERTNDERVTIGTAHLPSGTYVVRIDEGLAPVRWMKQ